MWQIKNPLFLLAGLCFCSGCDQQNPHVSRPAPPKQVIYRFDDHRYLELEGFYCEGALWYVDTQRKIRSEVVARDTPIFRVSFFKYVHPSEKYIAIPWGDLSGFLISRDYGQSWGDASFSPGGGADRYGKRIPARINDYGITVIAGEYDRPIRKDVVSMTVVNDQGFLLTRWGDLYISSKPFDDPRMLPGGTGIDYVYNGVKHHMQPRYNGTTDNSYWGKNYTSWRSVSGPDAWLTFSEETNWKNIPNKVPEVRDYTGWDHMHCDLNAGLAEPGKRK
ncbi:T6SS immunity protein Tli3 family protein [Pseudocitrobacter cyperus]|uniref:Tli3-like domain-containing protein n=1 Tax=Pseudocitrobacter cyperus TaxID=3112843 RepID=A0ABV0HGJ9_9ENTR